MKTKSVTFVSLVALSLATTHAHAQDDMASPQSEEASLPEQITGAELKDVFNDAMMDPELAAAVEEMVAETFLTGEPVEGWSAKGVYLPEWLAQRRAELGPVILYEYDGEALNFQYVDSEPPAFPEGYTSFVLSQGANSEQVDGAMISIAPGLWIEASAPYVRKGNAMCSVTSSLKLGFFSDRPVEAWSELEFAAAIAVYSGFAATAKAEVCTVYFEEDDGKITSRSYTRSGEPYTNLNAQSVRLDVMPADKAAGMISSAKVSNFLAD